jgi:hypothetical protein
MKLNIRLNNIAIETKESCLDFANCFVYYPNDYYGKMQSMINEGWEDYGNYIKKRHHNLHKSMFQEKEHRYVFATIKYDNKECCTELTTVGDRLLTLALKDREDFFEIYKIANQQILNHYKKTNESSN